MDPPPVNQTIGVFAVLVLVSTVVGAVAFSVRATVLSIYRKRASFDEESVAFSRTQEEHVRILPGQFHQQQSPVTDDFKNWNPLRRKISESPTNPFNEHENEVTSPSPQAVMSVTDDVSTVYSSELSCPGTPQIDVIGLLSASYMKRFVYLALDLRLLKALVEQRAVLVPVHKQEDGTSRSKVRLSQLLKFTYQIPRRHYQDVGSLNVAVDEILNGVESDPFMKTMSLFHFVTIGSTEQTYDNPYFFTRPFHRVISWCSDPSVLTEEPELLQMCIAVVLVCWSWNQWCCANGARARGSEIIRVLAQAASMAPDETYHCVVQGEVMAVLCLMYTGLAHFAPNVQKPILFKIATVMKACSSTAPCNAHRDLVPILAHAVSSTLRQSNLVVLYECLSVLVSPHRQCCLEYRDLAPPTSDLLALLRHGLWTRQSSEVREKARVLAEKLGEEFEQMEEWCDQGDTTSESLDNIVAPGAWLMFK